MSSLWLLNMFSDFEHQLGALKKCIPNLLSVAFFIRDGLDCCLRLLNHLLTSSFDQPSCLDNPSTLSSFGNLLIVWKTFSQNVLGTNDEGLSCRPRQFKNGAAINLITGKNKVRFGKHRKTSYKRKYFNSVKITMSRQLPQQYKYCQLSFGSW